MKRTTGASESKLTCSVAHSAHLETRRTVPVRNPLLNSAAPQTFFIVGCPRSGTTLLQVMLNRHPQIIVPPETKLFYYYHRAPVWLRRQTLDRINVDLGVQLSEELAERHVGTGEMYAELIRQYMRGQRKSNATHFGEKTPEHTSRVSDIHEEFPESPLVFMYRDGRDVALSLTRVPWIACDLRAGITIWKRYHRELVKCRALGRDNVLFLRYEWLVTEPERAVRSVLDHLGVPYADLISPQAEDFVNAFPERERGWKSLACSPVSDQRIGVWKRELNEQELLTVERLAEKPLRDLGYQLFQEPCKVSLWMWLRVLVSVSRTAAQLPVRCWIAEAAPFWGRLVYRPKRRRSAAGPTEPNSP